MSEADWKVLHIGFEGDGVAIQGFKLWGEKWRRVQDEPVMLRHPAHLSELHPFWIYQVDQRSLPIRFASTELSPGVYGFYVPSSPAEPAATS